jgi:hypothetical protein
MGRSWEGPSIFSSITSTGGATDSLLLRFPISGDITDRDEGGFPTWFLGIGGTLLFLLVKAPSPSFAESDGLDDHRPVFEFRS